MKAIILAALTIMVLNTGAYAQKDSIKRQERMADAEKRNANYLPMESDWMMAITS